MDSTSILTDIRDDGIATITMNRAEVHNAFNDQVIAEMTATLRRLGEDDRVRAVVLRAAGKSFSAGADLGWMQRMAGYGREENLRDAEGLAELMRTLNFLPRPTIAVVQGAAFGGGVGLVACCDIAIAAEGASFSLSEVRLGLIPAVISPYVVAAIGERASRRYFLTAERFAADEALRIGLVHQVVPADRWDEALDSVLARLAEGGPAAQKAAKDLIFAVAHRPVNAAVIRDTAERIATIRASSEGREGLAAFLEKRKPAWTAR
ncbi:enoyl-CoA hydratase/isomerase family protein [Skermanella sp. TT6]|uniref:Enoyl-CoA hydratase/isomerase family protein n=1 Tax=Skermanella cutis TaxID=2775420 RepID=A0ABX7BD78_9PROT|nr:enoyl-CoA hydratase/isomerase family protein [Skermanella sp. TT6]QQP91545.1 enoyl-CoA hydratase/isomerase family protein [Skermanella sp. TT6]